MTDEVRKALSDLTGELEGHEGPQAERAKELLDEARSAVGAEEHEGLGARLTEAAVHFEVDHPDLSAIIRRAAQLFGAAGI